MLSLSWTQNGTFSRASQRSPVAQLWQRRRPVAAAIVTHFTMPDIHTHTRATQLWSRRPIVKTQPRIHNCVAELWMKMTDSCCYWRTAVIIIRWQLLLSMTAGCDTCVKPEQVLFVTCTLATFVTCSQHGIFWTVQSWHETSKQRIWLKTCTT